VPDEASAAVATAVALLRGETPAADQKLPDGTPYVSVVPVLVGPEQVKNVVAAGDADSADLCTAELAAACAIYGVN
jgi:D-xylose transport system substrate-binding protein